MVNSSVGIRWFNHSRLCGGQNGWYSLPFSTLSFTQPGLHSQPIERARQTLWTSRTFSTSWYQGMFFFSIIIIINSTHDISFVLGSIIKWKKNPLWYFQFLGSKQCVEKHHTNVFAGRFNADACMDTRGSGENCRNVQNVWK